MSWSYDPTKVSTESLHALRLLIQDTDKNDKLLQNEELQFFLDAESGLYSAACAALRTVAARFARLSDETVGDVSVKFSQRSKQYIALCSKYEMKALTDDCVLPFAGGIGLSDKDARANDSDRVSPDFYKDLHENPRKSNQKVEVLDE